MQKIILLFSLVALIIGTSAQKVKAQASITAHATAEIIEMLTATEVSTLNFGRFSPETSGGEIKLSPNGARTASGTVTLGSGSFNPAIFYLTGQSNATVTVILPTVSAMLTNSVNGKTMEVANWESFPPAGIGAGVLSQGLLSLKVGATLKIGSLNDNPVGIYAGIYAVTFSYN